jgi:hypothetical protein
VVDKPADVSDDGPDEDRDERVGHDDAEQERPEFWSALRIDPVEIALPRGVGYTLRAYRLSTEVTASDVSGREDDFPHRGPAGHHADEHAGRDEDDDEPFDEDELDGSAAAAEDDEDEDGAEEPEEVPVFLGHRGRVYLFETREGLADFVHSDAEHDMTQLDTWSELAKKLHPADVVVLDEDSYELDLVVENLRGGVDAWDPALIIKAGEIARDLAYALRMEPVLAALSPGSPLDDLDEALRSTESGGIGSFFAKRRLRRIKEQQAALGWRTIIGKISAAVDWRE